VPTRECGRRNLAGCASALEQAQWPQQPLLSRTPLITPLSSDRAAAISPRYK
jgi:hypothetical protein